MCALLCASCRAFKCFTVCVCKRVCVCVCVCVLFQGFGDGSILPDDLWEAAREDELVEEEEEEEEEEERELILDGGLPRYSSVVTSDHLDREGLEMAVDDVAPPPHYASLSAPAQVGGVTSGGQGPQCLYPSHLGGHSHFEFEFDSDFYSNSMGYIFNLQFPLLRYDRDWRITKSVNCYNLVYYKKCACLTLRTAPKTLHSMT